MLLFLWIESAMTAEFEAEGPGTVPTAANRPERATSATAGRSPALTEALSSASSKLQETPERESGVPAGASEYWIG